MIRILLSRKLGEVRWTQAELSRVTGIREGTINEMYHEISISVKLEYLNLICEALHCDLSEILVYTPDEETQIDHYRTGKQKRKRNNKKVSV